MMIGSENRKNTICYLLRYPKNSYFSWGKSWGKLWQNQRIWVSPTHPTRRGTSQWWTLAPRAPPRRIFVQRNRGISVALKKVGHPKWKCDVAKILFFWKRMFFSKKWLNQKWMEVPFGGIFQIHGENDFPNHPVLASMLPKPRCGSNGSIVGKISVDW